MKLLFWNLYKKENSKYVSALMMDKEIDIAIFTEHDNLKLEKVEAQLAKYKFNIGNGGNDKIIALHRKNVVLIVKQEQDRYTLYTVVLNDNAINIVGVHLQANPYYTEIDRTIKLRNVVDDIKSLEKKTGIHQTMIIGDFNANPFSKEMVSKNGLNAVLYKDVICSKEVVTHDNKRVQRFYNPMMFLLSEEKKQYGSYYYNSGSDTLYWYLYDQVVVRKSLANSIKKIEYCKEAGEAPLIRKSGLPNKSISDHLPLFVEVIL